MKKISLLSAHEVQNELAGFIKQSRKASKLSRVALAAKSTVPASTIKKFETTGQISLRQFILLWQSIDDLKKLHDLTQSECNHTRKIPKTIDDVLKS